MNLARAGLADQTGLLLIGHGTMSAVGVAEANALKDLTARMAPRAAVEVGFLEFARPTPSEAIALLAARQVRSITIVPLLLARGGHARRDIPMLVHEAVRMYPSLAFVVAPHIGCQPAILELSVLRYREAVASRPPTPSEETLLLLISRGSRDCGVKEEIAAFARRRLQLGDVGQVETGFLGMTEPALDQVLAIAGASRYRQLVVQSHLLFAGELTDRIGAAVNTIAQRWTNHDWVLAEHLGPERLVVDAILQAALLDLDPTKHDLRTSFCVLDANLRRAAAID